jgi:GNAT superfamily N-acetyltransferase
VDRRLIRLLEKADMRFEDIDARTEGTFFRCLHDEKPDDPRVLAMRQRWHDAHKDKGLRAKVLVLDTAEVVGLAQYLPIEHSHLVGQGLMAILCVWVHGYDHHLGNRQGQGYGRFILDGIEADARASGATGVAAWGMDFPYWNPVSFYEHMGYTRCDQDGMTVLAWKAFSGDAQEPKLMRLVKKPPVGEHKVNVTMLVSGWCGGGCSYAMTAQEAVVGLDAVVDYHEVDTSERETMLAWGAEYGLFVDGEPFRTDGPPFSADELRAEIHAAFERKGAS